MSPIEIEEHCDSTGLNPVQDIQKRHGDLVYSKGRLAKADLNNAALRIQKNDQC